MNHDLNLINLWARKWRMSFNPDPTKQAVEVTFSKKRSPVNHPPIFFNKAPVKNIQNKDTLVPYWTPNCRLLATSKLLFPNPGKE